MAEVRNEGMVKHPAKTPGLTILFEARDIDFLVEAVQELNSDVTERSVPPKDKKVQGKERRRYST